MVPSNSRSRKKEQRDSGNSRRNSRNRTLDEPTYDYPSGSTSNTAEEAARIAFDEYRGGVTYIVIETTETTKRARITNRQAMEEPQPNSSHDGEARIDNEMDYSNENDTQPGDPAGEQPYTHDTHSDLTPSSTSDTKLRHGRQGSQSPDRMDYQDTHGSPQQTSEGDDTYKINEASKKKETYKSKAVPGFYPTDASQPRDEPSKTRSTTEDKSSSSWLTRFIAPPDHGRENKELVSANKALSRKNNTLEKKNCENLTRLRDFAILESQSNTQKATIRRHINDIKELRMQIEELTQEQQGMEEQIRTAQLAMSKKSSRPRVGLADEERTILGHFESLHREIRQWAKTWGNAEFSVIQDLNGEPRDKLYRQLAEVVVLDQDGKIPRGLKEDGMMTKSSMLCVSAILGKYICAEVLESPFRPLRSLFAASIQPKKTEDQDMIIPSSSTPGDIILTEMYRRLSKLHESKAQIWRTNMMNILDPPRDDSPTPRSLEAQEEALKRRTQAALDLTLSFLETGVGVLLPETSPEAIVTRNEQLQSIFQKALDVAGRLWKQLTIVKCVYLEDLKKEDFKYESELMAAHAFHKLGFDGEEDNRLDHQAIRIVVFPAVKGYGNSEGENYEQDRIWGKAIVWLDE